MKTPEKDKHAHTDYSKAEMWRFTQKSLAPGGSEKLYL